MASTTRTLAIAIVVLAILGGSLAQVIANLTTGTFIGTSNATTGFDSWLGIRFAQPPIGSLRFKAPVPITTRATKLQNASKFGNACPQAVSNTLGAPQSEDCLFLNVWRPNGTTINSGLPVLVWIHGGAWTHGAASAPSFDPTAIVQRSIAIGKPIVFVSMNYRMNTFGFLAGSQVPLEDLNAGLQDQRLALNFIHENIAAFGGDPSKVTIWGQSAGGGSVEVHFLFPQAKPLFRAGMANSGTGPFKSAPFPAQYDEPGKPFARLVDMVGCSLNSSSFECLQNVPFDTLLNISNTLVADTVNGQLWEPTVAPGTFIPERPSARIARGDMLNLPLLAGTNLNEGTFFSSTVRNMSHPPSEEDALFDSFIGQLILDNRTLTRDVLAEIDKLYPANGTNNGAPFQTGDSLFDRASAWYTDNMFLAPRRLFFDKAASLGHTLFAYFMKEFIPGDDPSLGVTHLSELQLLFGRNQVASVEADFADTYTDAYLSFVNDLNPGSFWPKFDQKTKMVLQLMRNNITGIPDGWNLERTAFLNTPEVLGEFEK